jgi:hypothetical protein
MMQASKQLKTLDQPQMADLARRYGVSSGAVMVLYRAIEAGHGTMAQFSHPELGGAGQWSNGGMTMIGDMFNDALKTKVQQLCAELAGLLRRQLPIGQAEPDRGEASLTIPASAASSNCWWGAGLGIPGASGSQNNIRYAWFPATRRLVIEVGSNLTVYDTADHKISGIAQQQSCDSSLTFVSQHGLVRVADLHVVSGRDF